MRYENPSALFWICLLILIIVAVLLILRLT